MYILVCILDAREHKHVFLCECVFYVHHQILVWQTVLELPIYMELQTSYTNVLFKVYTAVINAIYELKNTHENNQ